MKRIWSFLLFILVLAAVGLFVVRRTHRGVVILHYHAVRRMPVKEIHEGFWGRIVFASELKLTSLFVC